MLVCIHNGREYFLGQYRIGKLRGVISGFLAIGQSRQLDPTEVEGEYSFQVIGDNCQPPPNSRCPLELAEKISTWWKANHKSVLDRIFYESEIVCQGYFPVSGDFPRQDDA